MIDRAHIEQWAEMQSAKGGFPPIDTTISICFSYTLPSEGRYSIWKCCVYGWMGW